MAFPPNPGQFLRRIHRMPNYDCLRRSLKNAFGCSPCKVSNLRQSRRLEMMNDSKPYVPSGGAPAPSPKRRRPRLRVSCSPHPHPLPPGEGERWFGAREFARRGCSHRFFGFRFGGTRQPSLVVLPKRGRMVHPLLGERAGVRGNRAPAVLAASALDSAPENRPKGHMALSHSSFQASGFAEGR